MACVTAVRERASMLVKIMTCRATDPSAFGEAQRSWSRLAGIDGFAAQFGGWDGARPNHVLLVATNTSARGGRHAGEAGL